jgi:hypothetical protein
MCVACLCRLQVLFDPPEAAAYRAAAACSLDNGELLTVQVSLTRERDIDLT